jgi:hypothetical protein
VILQHRFDLAASNTLALPGRAALYASIVDSAELVAPELQQTPRFIKPSATTAEPFKWRAESPVPWQPIKSEANEPPI